ncbi:MAG: hypothetical protein IKI11_06855 [Neisseriaceae bacterium]|nr:hypothetical protein [Neisseriaceae bacterium]
MSSEQLFRFALSGKTDLFLDNASIYSFRLPKKQLKRYLKKYPSSRKA